GYGSIVGVGSNAAVLHFTPGARRMQPGDVVLVDAGAEVGRYTADVTRTYRLPGGDDGFFRSLHALVQSVEKNAIARCRPGAEWRDIHLAAAPSAGTESTPSWTSAASASKTTSSSPTPPPRSSPPQSPDRLLGSASLPNEDCLVRRSLLSASEPAPERGSVFVRGDPASGP